MASPKHSYICAALIIAMAVPSFALLQNPFQQQGNWYKANFHTHTKTSDGDVNVPVRLEQYKRLGYNIVAITDHYKTNKGLDRYCEPNFLVISSMEVNQKDSTKPNHHCVCIGVPENFTMPVNLDPEQWGYRVKAVGGVMFLAHPYWSELTFQDMNSVQGICALEVYNGLCTTTNTGLAEVYWDQLLQKGRIIPAIATDDTHSGNDVGRAFTMIKASQLTMPAVLEALRNGCFYASSGPIIKDFRVVDGVATIETSPVKEIQFMIHSNRGSYTRAAKNQTITTASQKIYPGTRYVRAQVIDADGARAWSNIIELQNQK